ncbi:MAG: DUF4352 domain-containing protein [Thermoleophilia bacterium]|nr:DUF4352 domain-containing protein [Thermoleophilia bacterium]
MKAKFRPLLLVALMVMIIPLAGADDSCSVEDEEPTVTKKSDQKDGNANSAGQESTDSGEPVAKVGDSLSLKGTTYKVTKVSTAKSVGDQYTGAKADGIFVIVDLDLTNEKSEPATIIEDNLRLISGGNEYSTSTDAIFAYPDQTFLLEEIQPGLTKSGKLIYDVPKSALNGAVLQVSDLFSDSTGDIELGL